MQEAFEEATDCLSSVISAHIAEKLQIPEPSPINFIVNPDKLH